MPNRRDAIKTGLLISSATLVNVTPVLASTELAITERARIAKADISHGPRNSKHVALTFHGAGADKYAKSILDQAKEAGIGITVMAVGSWVNEKPQWAKRVLADGHDLGNHTMHHLGIKHMTLSAATTEITQCARIIKSKTGTNAKWFRPSQTQQSNAMVRAAAGGAGYPYCISYNVDSLDYQDPAVKVVEHAVLSVVKAGDIVSMHLGHEVTTKALGKIISGLHAMNLKPVTLTQLLNG